MPDTTVDNKASYKPPSIREIARRAGVSASTVSRVVNKKTTNVLIADGTRRKVLDACKQLRYQPNVHALRLFGGRSNTVAVMVPPRGGVLSGMATYTDANLTTTVAGMLDAATDRGQHLMMVASDDRVIGKGGHLNLFRGRSIDGMLIWGAVEQDWEYINEIVAEGWPVVLVNSHVADESVPHMLVDNQAGGAALARHLIELGHRRIAFLAGPKTASAAQARRTGFETACREAEVDLIIRSGDFKVESGQALATELLASESPPTAIAAVDDVMAMGVIEAAQARGLSVPQDLSVTGGDDVFPYYKPRLTTLAMPMEKLGQSGLEMLLELVENADAWSKVQAAGQHIHPGKLMVGQTTASPRGDGS